MLVESNCQLANIWFCAFCAAEMHFVAILMEALTIFDIAVIAELLCLAIGEEQSEFTLCLLNCSTQSVLQGPWRVMKTCIVIGIFRWTLESSKRVNFSHDQHTTANVHKGFAFGSFCKIIFRRPMKTHTYWKPAYTDQHGPRSEALAILTIVSQN